MGCCLSKTDPISLPNPNTNPTPVTTTQVVADEKINGGGEKSAIEVNNNNKDVFVIQHRKSHDKLPDPIPTRPDPTGEIGVGVAAATGLRTSSCTKEEVDAILIQCGRLSRSSSGKLGHNNSNNGGGRKYSGSKRSFDFEGESTDVINGVDLVNNEISNSSNSTGEDDERLRRRRQSRGRRSSLSRSRERDGGGVSRRVSRSPRKTRSESPIPGNPKPGKLVSVPATVTSLSVEKGNNVGGGGEVKRVLVKRNVGSPRSQSPARGNGNASSNQGPLSRNGSRKAEHSPYRRTPLNEIDMNSMPFQPLANKRPLPKGKDIEEVVSVKQPLSSASSQNTKAGGAHGTHRRTRSRGAEGYEVTKTNYCRVSELQTPNNENITEPKGEPMNPSGYDALVTPVIVSGNSDTLKLPQTLMRSRSSRRSRDFDINTDPLTTPNPKPVSDYNSLLLQDIQNFHHKSNTSLNNALPPCVTKACSILEAVADLNSSSTDDKLRLTPREIDSKKDSNLPFVVESEVKVGDDLMEPSLHKYVTVRKRGGDNQDGEESSGSNSITVGVGTHNWASSSSWEPNSADSTDCWTSKSYSNIGEDAVDHQQVRGRGGPMQASSKATVA